MTTTPRRTCATCQSRDTAIVATSRDAFYRFFQCRSCGGSSRVSPATPVEVVDTGVALPLEMACSRTATMPLDRRMLNGRPTPE